MTTDLAPPRPAAERRRDAIARLEAREADAWVATASVDGSVHLVPLSYAWRDDRIVIAVATTSPTARNVEASGQARLGFGPTRDVLVVDAELDRAVPAGDAGGVGEAYATQADWDPRQEPDGYVFLVLAPRRIQAWRESNELAGRLLMRDGTWLA